MPRVSEFWKHFTKISSSSAKCNHCGNILKTSGNTSNLKCHEDDNFLSSLLPSTSQSSSCSNLSSLPSQQSITSAFQHVKDFKSGGKGNEKISQAIIFMICQDMQPIRTVERKGFLRLMKVCAPLYVVPSRFTIKRMINEKFDTLQHVLKEKLKEKYVTITTDAWTDIQMRSYLSATVHFIDKGDQMYNGNLGLIPLDENHTAEYLASKLKDLCSYWGLAEEYLVAIVTDGAPNIVKAAHLAFGQKKHIHCFAHNLNLVGHRAIERSADVQKLVDHVKTIVKWFKHSVVASDQLRKNTDKKLIQSVPTRWNSTFNMLQRFLELRPYVNIILNEYPSAPLMATANQIEDIKEIVNLLQPLDTATTEICGEEYLTGSLAIPMAHILKEKMQKITPKRNIGIKFQEQLLVELNKRFGGIECCSLFCLATILDPRFKTIYFKDPIQLSKALQTIDRIVKQNEALNMSCSATSSESESGDKNVTHNNSLFSDHNKVIQKKWRRNTTNSTDHDLRSNHSEVSLYIQAPAEKMKQKPLVFWTEMASTYPLLSKVAIKYLATTATSVPSERLFSKAGQIICDARNKLDGKFASK